MSPSKRSSSPTSASSSSDGDARDRPLGRSNFVVQWGGASAAAQGFAEVVFPAFAVADDGDGARPVDSPTAGSGTSVASRHLVLRRGATGALDLYGWWDQARRGEAPRRRIVVVKLLAADRSVALTWRFRNARPVSLAYSPLDAMQSGVLMETIEIAFDDVEMS